MGDSEVAEDLWTISEISEEREWRSDSTAIGTSIADTTSNGRRALDLQAKPVAAANS